MYIYIYIYIFIYGGPPTKIYLEASETGCYLCKSEAAAWGALGESSFDCPCGALSEPDGQSASQRGLP